jgi:uncharacterized repeat protein (TIGR01451 family)
VLLDCPSDCQYRAKTDHCPCHDRWKARNRAKSRVGIQGWIGAAAICLVSIASGCSALKGRNASNATSSLPAVDAISQAISAQHAAADGQQAAADTQPTAADDQTVGIDQEGVPSSPIQLASHQSPSQAECPEIVCDPCEFIGDTNRHRIRDLQEYVFDGGDQDPRVRVRNDWSALGVDPTDTVVYYETPAGKICVHPSNRVAIYAPRFGVVRQVTGAFSAENTLSPNRILAPVSPLGLEEQEQVSGVTMATGPIAQKQMAQLDRLHDERNPVRVASVIPPTPLSDAVSALINVDVSTVDHALSQEAIALQGRAAIVETTWLPESVSVMVSGVAANVVSDAKQAAELYVFDIPDRCSIRLTKQVSHQEAHSGDVIRFTIRFENVGPNKAGNVVIIDSLSPRLEYIEGSQVSSIRTRFQQEPNELGSSELRWEVESAVDVNDSGVISFDCRVR